MYSLIEYSDNYWKTSENLWQCCRDEPALNDAGALVNFLGNRALFKFKQKITSSTGDDGTKTVEIMVPFKYKSNFWRTFEMPLINCDINLTVTWSANCVISNAAANQDTTFAITDTKLYVPAVTLSTDNAKLLQQLKSGFKRTINWNKYEPKKQPRMLQTNILIFLIEPRFEGVNRLFVSTFNANNSRIGHWRYFFPTEKAEDHVMIIGRNFLVNQLKII